MRKSFAVAAALPLAVAPMVAAPAQADSVVRQKKLERTIEQTFLSARNVTVTAKCPKDVTWVRGSMFYCKVTDTNGAKGRVLVTMKSNATAGRLRWKVQ